MLVVVLGVLALFLVPLHVLRGWQLVAAVVRARRGDGRQRAARQRDAGQRQARGRRVTGDARPVADETSIPAPRTSATAPDAAPDAPPPSDGIPVPPAELSAYATVGIAALEDWLESQPPRR